MSDIEQALQTARERVWLAIAEYVSTEEHDDALQDEVTAALDANDALVAAVAKAKAYDEAYQSWRYDHSQAGGWHPDDMPGIGLISSMESAARAEVDRLVGGMRSWASAVREWATYKRPVENAVWKHAALKMAEKWPAIDNLIAVAQRGTEQATVNSAWQSFIAGETHTEPEGMPSFRAVIDGIKQMTANASARTQPDDLTARLAEALRDEWLRAHEEYCGCQAPSTDACCHAMPDTLAEYDARQKAGA